MRTIILCGALAVAMGTAGCITYNISGDYIENLAEGYGGEEAYLPEETAPEEGAVNDQGEAAPTPEAGAKKMI